MKICALKIIFGPFNIVELNPPVPEAESILW